MPSEWVFSRAFAEFSDTRLPQRVHEALIWNTHRDRLVGHLSRDSTAIEAREKPAAKERSSRAGIAVGDPGRMGVHQENRGLRQAASPRSFASGSPGCASEWY